jgi:hypothetical protein
MVRVSIEVRNGTARFRVGVTAQSVRRALSAVGKRYPGSNVELSFPIEPEKFFVHQPSAPARVFGHEQIQKEAA